MTMRDFTLIFRTMFSSSVMDLNVTQRWIWVFLIAMRDSEGRVHGTVSALARQAAVPNGEMEMALGLFQEPDPRSGCTEEEGRRIVQEEGNWWRIVSHKHFTSMESYERERTQRNLRASKHRATKDSNAPTVTDRYASISISDSDSCDVPKEEESEEEPGGLTVPGKKRFDEFWEKYPHVYVENRVQGQLIWAKMTAWNQRAALVGLEEYIRYLDRTNNRGTKYTKKASNWLRDECWKGPWIVPREKEGVNPYRGKNPGKPGDYDLDFAGEE